MSDPRRTLLLMGDTRLVVRVRGVTQRRVADRNLQGVEGIILPGYAGRWEIGLAYQVLMCTLPMVI